MLTEKSPSVVSPSCARGELIARRRFNGQASVQLIDSWFLISNIK